MSKRKFNKIENETCENAKKKSGCNWALGLVASMSDSDLQIQSDDLIVIIKDKYPKARYHYLILPKENISSIKSLNQDHLQLLRHMENAAKNLITSTKETYNIGYHAQPNMQRLHLHVISDDMDSTCLKTKQHWNSFTTKFFISSQDVCQMLEKNGTLNLPSTEDCKKLLTKNLQCHKCTYEPKNMPDLKKHILKHISC